MVRSASKIVESEASGEAQAQHREGSIQFETETAAVDASPEGQPGATTRSVTLGAKNEITADSINDLELGAPPPWRALPRISPPTGPPMAPGIGGFNIERPIPRAGHVESEVTWRRGDAGGCQNRAWAQAPIRAQRMAVSVDTRESSAISRALAVIGIVGVILLMFWDKTREQLNDMLEAATRSYNVP